jgi:putative transposase
MKRFIDENRGVYGVEPICKVLPIAPSTYYAHVSREVDPDKRPARAKRDARLRESMTYAMASELALKRVAVGTFRRSQ